MGLSKRVGAQRLAGLLLCIQFLANARVGTGTSLSAPLSAPFGAVVGTRLRDADPERSNATQASAEEAGQRSAVSEDAPTTEAQRQTESENELAALAERLSCTSDRLFQLERLHLSFF